jgi:hypothetical protein
MPPNRPLGVASSHINIEDDADRASTTKVMYSVLACSNRRNESSKTRRTERVQQERKEEKRERLQTH